MRTTTLGDLITNVYATFERHYDAELAGVATTRWSNLLADVLRRATA